MSIYGDICKIPRLQSEVPKLLSMENVGSNDIGYWRVQYFNIFGTTLLHTEYVLSGNDATWGAGSSWSAAPGGEAQPDILTNIHSDIDVYSTTTTILYSWDFTQSLTDSVSGKTISIPSSMTQDSTGLHLNGTNECTLLNNDIALTDKSIEVTFTTFVLATSSYCGILFISNDSGLIYTNDSRNWSTYFGSWTANISNAERNTFANSTLGVYIDSSRKWHIYKNGELFTTSTPTMQSSTFLQLGDSRTTGMTSGTIVTNVTIYDGNIFGGS